MMSSKSGESSGDPRNRKLGSHRSFDDYEGLAKEMNVGDLKKHDSFSTATKSYSEDGVGVLTSLSGTSSDEVSSAARSNDTSTVFGGHSQNGVVVSELCNVLDYRPSQTCIAEEEEEVEIEDIQFSLSGVNEETVGQANDDEFRYSDMSYAGGQSTNTRHSTDEVINNFLSTDDETEGSNFRYSDVSFNGGKSVNTRHSTENIACETFELDDEQFDVAVDDNDSSEFSNDEESYDVDSQDRPDTTESGFSELTFQQESSSEGMADLRDDVELNRRYSVGSDFDMQSGDVSLGTANFTVTSRNSDGSLLDGGEGEGKKMKIKETLFFM
jgi:hypothetical protein